ncbi:MAG TPA: glycosyltransferase family A protein [Verrucomicrobiae bacterium]|nr:glycosyltransferase family A protein [Verrucomicrobiae bacterium]
MCPIKLTLLICTRNRAAALERCLDSISQPEMVEVGGELLLVDNGSSDETPQVMRAFKDTAPFPVEIVTEPVAGLSRARNAGLAKARGEVIVFSDDDCYLAQGFLTTASCVFDSGQFHFCCGRTLLYDPTDSAYGCMTEEKFSLFPPNSFINAGEIQGTNMIFHRRVIERVGGFDPMLGAGTPFRCEDIDYCGRASMQGFAGAYVPELTVYHHHGRKPGSQDLERIQKDNDYARGAYYMKFILLGKMLYAREWLRHARKRSQRRIALRELNGGIRYAWARFRKNRENGGDHA